MHLRFYLGLSLLAGCAAAPQRETDVAAERAVRGAVDVVYATVSGGQGEPRDWDRLKALFVPCGTLVVAAQGKDGAPRHRVLTPDEFAEAAAANSKQQAFYEAPMVTRVAIFGGVAQVWSSYTARTAPDAAPFARGVNTFTLVQTAAGWRFVTIAWSEEAPGRALPPDLVVDSSLAPNSKS
jgi:hypothetical protein